MSDGPHRSLPMRPGWKRLAQRADNANFTPAQVHEALLPALSEDCRIEMTTAFLDAFKGVYGTLLKHDIDSQLEALRTVAGFGIGRTVLDYAAQLAANGDTGIDAAEKALASALIDRATRGARQTEEFYCRVADAPRGLNVRDRIDQAIGNGVDALARQVLKIDPKSTQRTPPKHQDLDDGVNL